MASLMRLPTHFEVHMYLSQSHEYRQMQAEAHVDRLDRCCSHDCDSDPEQDVIDGTNGLLCDFFVEDHYEVRCDSHGGVPKPLCAECLHVTHHDDECSQPRAKAAQRRREAAGYTLGLDS